MAIYSPIIRWLTSAFSALSDGSGTQSALPTSPIIEDMRPVGIDHAMQIAAVWACVERRATTVSTLPIITYATNSNGAKIRATTTRLYELLKRSPNSRMTSAEFWSAMMVSLDLRGNAFARLDRDPRTGEVVSMYPMAADQVEMVVLDDGEAVYYYRVDRDVYALAASSVLHLRGLGNGRIGLSRLDYMRATTDELAKAQESASRTFGSGGRPTGALMIDSVLRPDQRDAIRASFGQLASGGSTGRLVVLEAGMKYQQLSISPEDQQLLESRRYGVEEICRWFDVPPILIHATGDVTAWGSGIEQIIRGFHTFTIRPLIVAIEQAITRQILTPAQRAQYEVEISHDALLRGSARDRAELYSIMTQHGIMTRNECRRLENLPAVAGADELTVPLNLISTTGADTNAAA